MHEFWNKKFFLVKDKTPPRKFSAATFFFGRQAVNKPDSV